MWENAQISHSDSSQESNFFSHQHYKEMALNKRMLYEDLLYQCHIAAGGISKKGKKGITSFNHYFFFH